MSGSLSPARRRKITVNERIEEILHGALLAQDARTASAEARDDAARRRSRQLAALYSSSMDDKFVRARLERGPQSVPKHMHLGTSGGGAQRRIPPLASALSPTWATRDYSDVGDDADAPTDSASPSWRPEKCYAKAMLRQQAEIELAERREREAQAYPAPDFTPPRPWYKGYSTHHKAPSCTVDAKVRRYGAYGTIKMLAAETIAGTAPAFELNRSQSLDALAYKDTPSAWSPSLHGSPSLWPEDANYAHGTKLEAPKMIRCPSPKHRFPTHCVGKMAPDPEDKHYERLQRVHGQDTRALEAAYAEEKARRRREIEYNRGKHAHWQAQLQFEPLSSKIDHPFIKVNAKRVKELTILHNPEYSTASRFHEQVARLTDKRFALRWRNMAILLDVMRRTPCRRPVLQDIDKLFHLSYELSLKNLNHLELTRQQFWELFQKEYPMLELPHANRLFSSYDCAMEDRIDMRLFLATVRALRVQQGTPIEILCLALQDFDLSQRQVVTKAAHLRAVLCMCAASEAEEHELGARATGAWGQMLAQFANERERRRIRRLQGESMSTDAPHHDGGDGTDPPERDTDTESSSDLDSLLFLGKEEELELVPIPFVRRFLRDEKALLGRFTELLLRRREECFASAPPLPPRSQGGGDIG